MVLVLVVLTMAACITIGFLYERKAARARAGAEMESLRYHATLAPARQAVRMPAGGYFFHGGHTWAELQSTGEARVGIDDFARGVIGRIDGVELPATGAVLRQGEKAFTLIQNHKRIDFVSPLDGVVCQVNAAVSPDAAPVRTDPYREGWIVVLKPANLARDLKRLKVAGEAKAWIEKETRRFADFLTLHAATPGEVGVTMTDGGLPAAGVLEWIDGELFHNLVRKFFK